jgi:hypothetical protein
MEDHLTWLEFKDPSNINDFIEMICGHHLKPGDGLQRLDQFLLTRHDGFAPFQKDAENQEKGILSR